MIEWVYLNWDIWVPNKCFTKVLGHDVSRSIVILIFFSNIFFTVYFVYGSNVWSHELLKLSIIIFIFTCFLKICFRIFVSVSFIQTETAFWWKCCNLQLAHREWWWLSKVRQICLCYKLNVCDLEEFKNFFSCGVCVSTKCVESVSQAINGIITLLIIASYAVSHPFVHPYFAYHIFPLS